MTIRENYEKWLKDFSSDEELIRELEAIRDDEKEIEDRFYTELSFGTAGMRGVLGAGMIRMSPPLPQSCSPFSPQSDALCPLRYFEIAVEQVMPTSNTSPVAVKVDSLYQEMKFCMTLS